MLTNRRNLVSETIALIFLAARDDVCALRLNTTEPNEHIFGGWRGHNPGKREFSVLECCELEEKRARAIDGK